MNSNRFIISSFFLFGFCLLLSFSFFSIFTGASTYSCKSPTGADVDWFVAYKLPNSISNGTSFLYADSKNGEDWTLSKANIEDETSAIGRTILQIFEAKKAKTDLIALYNDENPNDGKTDSGRAHMKGVVVSSNKNGFWLVHSVPKFPLSSEEKYLYPESGKRNGQSFFCLSFSSDALEQIGHQLFVAQPNFYDVQLPSSFEEKFADLANSINKKSYPKSKPSFSVANLQLLDGTKITSFSKHKRFAKDLYYDLVAPELKSSFYTETWLVGPGDLPSDCDTNFKIHNIQSIQFSKPFDAIKFDNTKDHSKWAVSQEIICIGDINRQKSQSKRGGGTVCMKNKNIAKIYFSAIGAVECCINETECSPNNKQGRRGSLK
uniref:Deoxyribonuclease II n=1 Tax=Meloidogyne incognita TaxID=6306 RepID=A0A914KG89_MELIC